MHILLITDGIYPIVLGGMQKHSYYLAKFLTKKNIKVTLVHCINNDSIDENKFPEFADFNKTKITFKGYKFPSLDAFPGHYVRENKAYSKLVYNDLKQEIDKFDLIYCQGFVGWKFIKEAKKGNVKTPIVSNLHGYEMFQKAPSLRVKLEHYLIRGIAKYISVNSNYVFSFGGKITRILKEIGVADSQIIESPIGIEASWLNKENLFRKQPARKFVFIGRYERRKGIEELTEALTELINEKVTNFEFHFVGGIPKEQQLKSENIIYHGTVVGDEKIQNILRQSDVLLVPSYSEGMPTVIMEAMASGLAIIGSNVGAVSQQVDATNGWLIDNSKVETIKLAIKSAINISDATLEVFKKRSLIKVQENFLWEEVIKHKIKCFTKMIDV